MCSLNEIIILEALSYRTQLSGLLKIHLRRTLVSGIILSRN